MLQHIHGIAPNHRCPHGVRLKSQCPVDGHHRRFGKLLPQLLHLFSMYGNFHFVVTLILVVNNSHALGLFLSEFDAKVWGISWVVKKKAWSFVVDHKRPQMTTKGIVKRYNKKELSSHHVLHQRVKILSRITVFRICVFDK